MPPGEYRTGRSYPAGRFVAPDGEERTAVRIAPGVELPASELMIELTADWPGIVVVSG